MKITSLHHIDGRFKRSAFIRQNGQGLIHQIRTSLGMTLKKLGENCGVSIPTISQIENREVEGRITLETLQKVANAMNCEVKYQFVPKSKMKNFVENAAYEKAKRILSVADLHMSLENQKVSSSMEERIQKLKEKLISRGDVW